MLAQTADSRQQTGNVCLTGDDLDSVAELGANPPQADRQTGRQTNRQTDRQSGRETHQQ